MRRTKEDAERTRKQIMTAALKLFSRQGYTNTTLEDIARSAGVTRGAVYWHFENKAALYKALIDEANIRGDDVIARAMESGGTAKEICKKIMVAQWTLLEEDEDYRDTVRLVLFNTGTAPELDECRRVLLENSTQLMNTIAQYMKAAIEMGELRSDKKPIELTQAFLAYQQGVTVNWLQNPEWFSIKEMAPHLADIFIHGI